MRCPKCNQEIDLQDKFCGSCGYSLNTMNTEKESEAPLPKKRKRKAVGVGVALVVVVCVLAAVLFFVFRKGGLGKETASVKNSPKPTEQPVETEQPKEEETPTPTPTPDAPYWQNFFEEGSNTLTEQQWEEAYLLFRKAWSYYGDSDYEVSVDMDEIDFNNRKIWIISICHMRLLLIRMEILIL